MKQRFSFLLAVMFVFLCTTLTLTSCFGTPKLTVDYADGVTGVVKYTDSSALTEPAAREGYLFNGWTDKDGNVYTTQEIKTVLDTGKSLRVTAVWIPHTHRLGETVFHSATCQHAAFFQAVCEDCGATVNTPLPDSAPTPHTWVEATFTLPRHCTVCNLAQGTPLQTTFYYNLPTVNLTTNDGIIPTQKTDVYSAGTFTMTGADEYDIPISSCGIRVRGNYSTLPDKKAYRIRFDEKTSLFGRPQNRSWVLLADYLDVSHIKNFAAYNLSARLDGLEFAPLTRHVSVTFNGQWLGVYMLSDHINEKEGRVNIEQDMATVGDRCSFLLELDEYADQDGPNNIAYFTYVVPPEKGPQGKGVTLKFNIKYPTADERVSQAQFDYIKAFTTAALDVLFGIVKDDWRAWWDEDSLIDHFLVQQWTSNGEMSYKSIYLYQRYGEKMKMGPVWDFDWAIGGPNWIGDPNASWPQTFCNPNTGGPGFRGNGMNTWRNNAWFTYLWENDAQFVVNFYERWQSATVEIDHLLKELVLYKSVIADAIDLEMEVWDRCQTSLYLTHPYGKASGQYDLVLELLADHTQWMNNYIYQAYRVAKVQLSIQQKKP